MPIEIDEGALAQVKEMFKVLNDDVKIYFFRKDNRCEYCDDIEHILDTIGKLSEKLHVVKLSEGSNEAKRHNIPMFPAILIHGKKEYNIRYFGIPAGYEFGALIEDIIDVSRGDVELDPYLKEVIREKVKKPVRLMVFVTPTCPYCPLAVRTSHRLAIINTNISGDMIEALEFQDLANKYLVYAVPKIVIQVENEDKTEFEGALPPSNFVAKILEALGEEVPPDIISRLGETG
ncbi:MAG TPA: glutaredoxin [Thermofilum sp.]|nr:glutaredoxin [Thermofilum sp.]